MAKPASYLIDQIRGLAGKPRITEEMGSKKVERVSRFPKADWELPIYTPDPDHAECLLVEQFKLSEDAQYVEAYRLYLELPGEELRGQEYDETLDMVVPFTRQRTDADSRLGENGWEVTPESSTVSMAQSIDRDAFAEAIEAIHVQIPTQEEVRLPDVLESVTVYWDGQKNDGYGAADPVTTANGTAGQGALVTTFTGSARATAVVDGDVAFVVREGFSGPVPATIHVFYLLASEATTNAVRNKVGATNWPTFRPRTRNLVLFGQSRGVDYDARFALSQVTFSGTEGTESRVYLSVQKTGESRNGGCRTKNIPLPAALNQAITITHVASSEDVTLVTGGAEVTAEALIRREAPKFYLVDENGDRTEVDVLDMTGEGVINTAEDFSVEVVARGKLSQSTIPATTPATFPTGTYLVTSRAQPYRFGWVQITAVTVEITGDVV